MPNLTNFIHAQFCCTNLKNYSVASSNHSFIAICPHETMTVRSDRICNNIRPKIIRGILIPQN